MTTRRRTLDLYALLIGIGHYEPNDLCVSLKGPAADVRTMEEYLRGIGVGRERIAKLTVSATEGAAPPEPREKWPTYQNMVAAIRALKERAVAAGAEEVLIYYCGHGGRVPALFPDVKGAEGFDEGLVPPDVGEAGARYLRDVEITYLVNEMVSAGLFVTLILDACHSGGALRGKARLVVRGTGVVDGTPRPEESLVAPKEELEATWRRLHNRVYVTRGRDRDWIPDARGSVFLAACEPTGLAYEYPFGGKYRGVMTYHLLELLKDGGNPSYRQLHQRLVSRVRGKAERQTPVLEGEVDRRVFGGHLLRLLRGIPVFEVDRGRGRVRLGAGPAQGVHPGALLRIHPAGTLEEDAGKGPRTVVEVREGEDERETRDESGGEAWVEGEACWAYATAGGGDLAEVRPGHEALLIDPGDALRRKVALVTLAGGAAPTAAVEPSGIPDGRRIPAPEEALRDGSPSPAAALADPEAALAAVRRELEERPGGFLEPAGGEAPDFQLAVTGRGDYEIWHADGVDVDHVPPLPAQAPGAARRVVERLAHLARFHNVRDLHNPDPRAPRLSAKLGLLPPGFAPGDAIEPEPLSASLPEVETGRWVCLTVGNDGARALYLYVLDLQPGWSVEKVHPRSGLELLEGEREVRLPFEIYLPPEIRRGRETLKVFATTRPVDARWLELPPIDRARPVTRAGGPASPLERLLAAMAEDAPRTRGAAVSHASRYWATAQVEFEVVAAPG